MKRIGLRALVAVVGALAVGLVATLMPVSAHITQDDPAHNWNQHYFELAKQDFFTKQKANQRFISRCEPGSLAAGLMVDTSEITLDFQDASSLPGGSAFTCVPDSVALVRRDAVGEYSFRVSVPLGVKMEDILISSITIGAGDGDDLLVSSWAGPITLNGGVLTVHTTVYKLSDPGTGVTMTKFDPPRTGIIAILVA